MRTDKDKTKAWQARSAVKAKERGFGNRVGGYQSKAPLQERKKAGEKAWAAVAKRVKDRHGNSCYTCGATPEDSKDLHAGHFFRSDLHASVRYDERNLRPQCRNCNITKSGNLEVYAERLIEELGEDEFENLRIAARQPKKWTIDELQEISDE